ncbi:MAG: hypothetical protein JRH01_09435 [Deltaproteobacteria bacterium]|nr:hypothetical protein [Deltaproteobacteria bacterium]MBW2393384.1 hypothetical protein [Deltaproteobacteria bacterium]
MWRAHLVLALVLLLGHPGFGEGSFTRVSAPPKPETSAPESESGSQPAPAAATPVPAAPAPEVEVPEVEIPRGKACIYGPKGLIFQPRGKQCAAAGSSPASSDRAPGGRCILGARGQVLYAPPGISCEDTLQ